MEVVVDARTTASPFLGARPYSELYAAPTHFLGDSTVFLGDCRTPVHVILWRFYVLPR